MLNREMVQQGARLFRWRSYLPLALLPVGLAAIWESGDFDRWFGESGEELWVVLCLVIAMTGQAIRTYAVGHVPPGTSGRNTHEQRAVRLNTTGLYSVCRHPLYLANFIAFAGILMAVQIWWFVILGVLAFWIYYERIMVFEEAFLFDKFGAPYAEWSARTPAFIPALKLWRRPDLPFSWKMVLRREPYGYFAIISVFFVIELVADVVVEGDAFASWLHEDAVWPVMFVIGAVLFFTLRTLKKHTRLLRLDASDI